MTNFKGFGDFAKRAPGMMKRAIRVAGMEVPNQTIRVVSNHMRRLNPPRSNEDHAHFVDSWFFGRNSVRMGGAVPELRPGDSVSFANDSPHALILDLGLSVIKATRPAGYFKRSDAKRRGQKRRASQTGRRIGTPTAPRGYSRPAFLAARAARRAIIKSAIRKGSREL